MCKYTRVHVIKNEKKKSFKKFYREHFEGLSFMLARLLKAWMVGVVTGSHSLLLTDHFQLLLTLPDSGYLNQIFRFFDRPSIMG